MAGDLAGDSLKVERGAVEQFQRPLDPLQEVHPVPFGGLKGGPSDAADLGHGRETVVHLRGITIRLPRVAPGPVDAESASACRVRSRNVVLVICSARLLGCAHWPTLLC